MAAIFFDIDGTLLDRDHKLPDSTREAIKQAKENGHEVFINSGRTKAYIHDKELLSLGFDGILCGCGTHIIYHGEELMYHPLSMEVLDRCMDLFYEYEVPLIMEGRKWLFMDEDLICRDDYGKRLFQKEAAIIQPIRGNRENWEASKFSAAIHGIDYEPVAEALSDEFTVLNHEGMAMEFVPKGFSKATAIEQICDAAGFDLRDTYSFGDGVNDIDMLKKTQYGIVMGNGKEQAKAIADYVTQDIHEDGIYRAMKHFELI